MRERIQIGGRSRDFESRYSREEVINCYIDSDAQGEFKRLVRLPGFDDYITIGTGQIRALHVANNVLYAISGQEAYRISATNVGGVQSELLGNVAGFSGPARIASIGTDEPQVMFLTNNRGFVYKNSDQSFTEVTDVDFDPDFSVTAFNQRFWFNKPNSNEFFASDILDGLSYDPLFFASAENKPDPLVYVQSLNTELYLFGTRTIERWQDTGATQGFPLRRITGSTIDRGLGAKASIATWETNIFFLADDFTVRKIGANGYEKISNLSFEEDVQDYSFPETAEGFFVDRPDHKIYYITFPRDGVTWGYNVTDGVWMKRSSKSEDVDLDRWRIGSSASIFNKIILGDSVATGKLYVLNQNTYSEAGIETPMKWVTPPVKYEKGSMTISRLELFPEVGVGTVNQVNNIGIKEPLPLEPKVRLRVSKDGGVTFTGKKDRGLGRVGDRKKKVIWRNMGRVKRGQALVFEFSVNDDVKTEFYEAWLDVELGVT